MKDYLIISEQFYSIQGEGKSIGTPAVFLRLAACNLTCQGFSYKHPDTDEHLGCDSAAVWRRGKRWNFSEILQHWRKEGWLEHLAAGAHLVITGGEPLLQQNALLAFIQLLDESTVAFIEIETNATLLVDAGLLTRLNQINASPKLIHAGDTHEKRYNADALQQLANMEKICFKFVVSQPEQWHEIMTHYLIPFTIPKERVWLMAEGGTQNIIQQRALWLIELCKTHHLHYSPRLHIDIWGEVTGV